MAEPIIDVQNLEKNFDKNLAVHGLSFDIRTGEFFGLLGPNGAGKSTTIGMLTGLIHPTKGNILIQGSPFPTRTRETQRSIGFVPQDFAFYPTMSALDNLNFFGRIYGLSGERLRHRREATLTVAGLTDRAHETVAHFSNGMKRRLNLAIALLHEPAILILDEPTVGVDAHSRYMLLDRLKELNDHGVTILYTTHYMEEAQRLCARVAVMDHGSIIALDSPSVLIRRFGQGGLRMELNRAAKPSFLARLEGLGDAALIDGKTNEIFLHTRRTKQALKKTIELAEKEKVSIKSVNVMEENLESVFLNLTGRSLRDQDEHVQKK